MRIRLASVVLLALLAAPVVADEAEVDLETLRSSVIQVEVTLQGEDYWAPWRQPNPFGTGGSGFFIGEGRLLTNAHVVGEARIIRVKRPDRPDKVDARVLHIAHDSDLAMVTVDDASFFEGMIPLEIGGIPELRSMVTAVGYPIGGKKLSITSGVVSRIELHDYVHTGVDRHLAIQIDAAINPGNSGGPVLQGGKVVGVAFQTQFFSQNIGYMIPTPVVHHFLEDIEDGSYDGYPSIGIITANLENPALREWLGVPEGESGVIILKALPHSSGAKLLKPNDVLHAIDGIRIENDGTVNIDGEFLELAYVVQGKHVGDEATLKIRRAGELMEFPLTLESWNVKMKEGTAYEERPEYLVWGGYVFVPLTSNYVARAGWRSELGYWLSEFYRTLHEAHEGQEQLVVLSRVLRHDSTRYRDYQNVIVKSVNGTPPKDFEQFVELVTTSEEAVVEFEGVNVEPLVLDREKIRELHEGILGQYGIDKDRHVKGGGE